jgi:hypothetical protein
MNSIKINVVSDNGVTLGALDVSDDDLNIIYQLSDIREPEKRKANYVRQFTLTGSKNNNRIFSNIFEGGYNISDIQPGVPTSKSYNPNLKLNAQVILNDNIFFEGTLQLNKINKVDNKLIGYDVTIYGTLGDFFGDIGDTKMTSLDVSEYNHKLTRDNIVLSWNMRGIGKSITQKSVNGQLTNKSFTDSIWKYNILTPNDIGDGYVYPLIYQGGSNLSTYVSIDKWSPSIYAYTLMKKIFDKWGWKWKSEFFESELFKRLIIPFSKDSLMIDESQKNKSEFLSNCGVRSALNAQVLTTHTSAVANTQTSSRVQFIYDSPSPSPQPYPLAQPEGRDEGGTFNTQNGIWTCPKNGQFKLQSKLHMTIGFLQLNLGGSPIAYGIVGPNVPFKVKLINADTNAILSETSGQWLFSPTVKTVGNYYQTVPCLVEWSGFLSVGTRVAVIVETQIPQSQFPTKTINLQSGQYFNCPIRTYPISYVDDASYFSASLLDKQLQEGDDINMNGTLPDIYIKDFITGINKMFNLYWVPSGYNKEFTIEPRDTLFNKSRSKILDWTKFVHNGQILSIEPLYNLTNSRYKWSYMSDSDYLNTDYLDTNGEVYGSKTVSIQNDFQFDVSEISTIFSASPLYTPPFNDGITLSAFVTKDGTKFKRATPKLRILYWGGMKDYSGSNVEINDQFGISGSYLFRDSNGRQMFPYAGHLDDTSNPTIDLSYSISKSYYFTFKTLTDNGLYNRYWKSFTEELIDPNQHLLTCRLYLPSMLMLDLDLRTVIQVDNIYYRINKITYNPLNSIAEAELFKLKSYTEFTPSYITSGSLPSTPVGTTNTSYTSGWGSWNSDNGIKQWLGGTQPNIGVLKWDRVVIEGENIAQFNPASNSNGNWETGLKSFDGVILPTQPRTMTKVGTNTYAGSESVNVNGDWNIVAPTSQFITVNGSFNNVTSGVKNASIIGDYNTILPGVSNVSIVGNNIIADKSNTQYINGVQINSNKIQSKSTTIVRSPIQIESGVVMGGKNSVGSFVSGKTSKVVIGNAPTTIRAINISPLGPPPPSWIALS